MPNTFQAIYGKENSESESFLYNSIRENIKNGKYSYILVPEQYSLSCEKAFITELGVSAQTHAEVLTFSRLCNLIFSEVGPLRGNYINNAGKHMLVQRAIQLLKDKLRYFSKSVSKQGFTGIILNMLTEFKRYSVTPEQLMKASEECDEENLSNKLYDFSIILECFNLLSEEKYNNSEDNLEIIIPRISMCKFNCGTLYISFFKSFTPSEYQVIQQLMQVMDVKILLCADDLNKPSEIFETSVYTYKKLCEIADCAGSIHSEPIKLADNKIYRKDELNSLADMYFGITENNSDEAPKRLHTLNPSNFYNEVRDTALVINHLCKKHGYKHSDFLVLAGNLSDYNKFIPQLFEKYGLNYFIDQKEPVLKTPVYRLVAFLLDTAVYGLSYDRVMSIARLGFLSIPIRELDIFDNYLLAAGVSHKMWNSDEDWTFNPDKRLFDMAIVNRVRVQLLNPVKSFISGLSGRKTVTDICEHIGAWLNKNNVCETLKSRVRIFEKDGDLKRVAVYKSSWNSLIAQLKQMNDILGDTSITYEKFGDIFNSSAEHISIGTIPQALDGVMVSEISHFRNTTSEVVIVLGTTEGVFPKDFPIYGILSDIEREELKKLNIELAPTALSKQLEERYHIFNVLRTPASQLYFSVPKQDNEGTSLMPSPIIRKLKELFPKLEFEMFDENSALFTQDKTAALDILLSKAEISYELTPIWQYIKKLFFDYPEYRKQFEKTQQRMEFSKTPETLSKAAITKLYGKNLSLSVSRLEKFNECAFAYFMKYGLYLSPRLKADFRANDMGSALHLILSEYFKKNSGEQVDYEKITYSEVEKEIHKLSDEITREHNTLLYESSSYYRYLSLKIREIASVSAWEVVKFYKNSSFRPYGFELAIGGSKPDIPAKTIKTKHGNADFRGFIDRADYYMAGNTSYISILDYKSSEKRLKTEHIKDGIQLQPLAYMNAICSSIQNSEPAAILYMHLNNPVLRFSSRPDEATLERERHKNVKLTGWSSNKEDIVFKLDKSADSDDAVLTKSNVTRILKSEFDDALKAANEKIYQSTSEIFEGKIEINPYVSSDFNACEYCDYHSICSLKM